MKVSFNRSFIGLISVNSLRFKTSSANVNA